MSEESKPPKKTSPTIHVINLVAGLVGAVACFGFVLLAHRAGLKLTELTQDGLIIGGALSAGVSVYGAKKMAP